MSWLDDVIAEIADDPDRIIRHFPAVGRRLGRDPVDPSRDPQGLHGTLDDMGRARLIEVLIDEADSATASRLLVDLYRHGDDAERRGVLRGLEAIDRCPDIIDPTLVDTGLLLVTDALRTNDPRLVAAALGCFAARHLPPGDWRGGVLKCLFMQIPLAALSGVEDRRDGDLKTQAMNLATERWAAGRPLSADLTALISDHPIPA